MEEKDVIKRIKNGDKEAMGALFQENVNWSVSLAYLVVKDWKEAEDAVQNAFICVFKSMGRFDETKDFKPWFTRIVVNEAKKIRRKGLRWVFADYIFEKKEEIFIQLEEQILDKEHKSEILKKVYNLKEKHRMVVILKYYMQFSEKEIADALKIPVSTVKSRLYVARQELKESMKNDWR